MKVIDKLKLNRFIPVSVPRNKDLYSRVGGRVPQMGTTGFKSELCQSKMDVLASADKALLEEYSASTQTQ